MTDEFYSEQTEASFIKSEIVSKYFGAWANVLKGHTDRLAYVDLFAGPGVYEDGNLSTPIKVILKAFIGRDIADKLVMVFNDSDPELIKELEEIVEIFPLDSFKYPPIYMNHDAGSEIFAELAERLKCPALLFVDPWGYKGISIEMIATFLSQSWGSECFLFFNYNRINMAIQNNLVHHHLEQIFGSERLEELRRDIDRKPIEKRELVILEALISSLTDAGAKYVLPFRFAMPKQKRTSHFLVFATTNPLGYTIAKEIASGHSAKTSDGVSRFEYIPASRDFPRLFEYSLTLEDLKRLLLQEFAGKTLKMDEIFASHHIGRPFIKANYKAVLLQLEDEGIITVDPPKEKRPMRRNVRTFGDNVVVTFPGE